MLVLLKNNLNYLKDSIFECFLKEYKTFLFQKKSFFTTYNDGKFKLWRRKIIKDIINLFRLKKELYYTAIKYIRNLFR